MSKLGRAMTFGFALAGAVVLAATLAYRAVVQPTGALTPHDIPTACCLLEPQNPAIKANARTAALTTAYNASGQQLFAQFAASPGNIVFSPYSIGTAMAMALTGARGETAAEMAKVLMHRLVTEDIDAANGEALALLSHNNRPAKLLTANALMLTRRGDLISSNYAALLRAKYAAEVFNGAGLDDINGWVSRNTDGKIAKLLDQLDPASAAVLLDAAYFKGDWEFAFDRKWTHDAAFDLPPLQQVRVPTMHRTGDYALVARNDSAIGMVVVLPNEIEGLRDIAVRLDANELTEVFTALRDPQAKKLVALALPRFKVEFNANLAASFRQAGMKNAFDPNKADFSGMTGRPLSEARLRIGNVMHRAVIQVGEESTEVAAATAVEMVAVTAPYDPQALRPEPFRVDRPFLFYVVDDVTGAILFQGRVTDPVVAANRDQRISGDLPAAAPEGRVRPSRPELPPTNQLPARVDLNPDSKSAPLAKIVRHSGGWTVRLAIVDPTTAISYRIGETGEFRDTGYLYEFDPNTRKRKPNPEFELDVDQPATTIYVRYIDGRDVEAGPFPIAFDPVAALERDHRETLAMTKGSWIEFRRFNGLLMYYTHLISYNCAIREVRIGIDNPVPDKAIPLPPCDLRNPGALREGVDPTIKLPPATKMVSVELTYRDGSVSERKSFSTDSVAGQVDPFPVSQGYRHPPRSDRRRTRRGAIRMGATSPTT